MQNFRKRNPYEYQGEMVMQTPKNPYSPSRGKSKMLSGSGYASSSGPYRRQVSDPYGDRFDRSDINTKFERTIEDIIDEINNGRIDGQKGEKMISRLREDQQKAKGDYVRNAYETRPQSPAKAQFNVYNAKTGGLVTGNTLDQMYRNDAAMYRQLGGSSMGGSSQNPYLMSSGDRSAFEANSKYQTAIDDARKPKFGVNNWNF